MDINRVVAENLANLRRMRGLSLSELARRANLNKGTLSKLESAGANPSIETVWALADALGVALSDLVTVEPRPMRVIRSKEAAWLEGVSLASLQLDRLVGRTVVDMTLVRFVRGDVRHAGPHAVGAMAHVLVTSGVLKLGATDEPIVLYRMDYAAFPADRPHVYEALEDHTEALVLNSFIHNPVSGEPPA